MLPYWDCPSARLSLVTCVRRCFLRSTGTVRRPECPLLRCGSASLPGRQTELSKLELLASFCLQAVEHNAGGSTRYHGHRLAFAQEINMAVTVNADRTTGLPPLPRRHGDSAACSLSLPIVCHLFCADEQPQIASFLHQGPRLMSAFVSACQRSRSVAATAAAACVHAA